MEDTAETSYCIVKHQRALALRLITAKRRFENDAK
jgi:hypothetical protein